MVFQIDKLHEIYSTVRKNKLRTLLTGFTVSWGIFMLILLLGSGTGIENGVKDEFKNIATNSIWVHQGQTSIPYAGLQLGRKIQFTDADYEDTRTSVQGVEHLTARYYKWNDNLISYKKAYGNFHIIGCHPDHQFIEKTIVRQGRMINATDIKEGRKVAAIGSLVREQLFMAESPIGKYINVNGVPFKVVGVFFDEGSDSALRTIYLPITSTRKVFGGDNRIHALIFTTGNASIQESRAIEQAVREKMAARHKFAADDEKALRIWNGVKTYQKIMNLFVGIRVFIWVVGIGTIIAGIVGISNIMLIAVKERTREIGIRKTLGATPISIVSMILTEAMLITLCSGYIGLVAGVAVVETASAYVPAVDMFQHPEVDFRVAIGAIVLLVSAGLIAGFIPARKAAKILPVEALREE